MREPVREPYDVVAGGRAGVCFAWTRWGRARAAVRWYWVRHDDGSEKAYSASQIRRPDREPAT